MLSITSPFEDIISLQRQKDRLLHDVMLKQDEKEISIRWTEYIEFCIPVLDKINNLTQLLFKRYYDEFSKDEKPEQTLLEKIRNLLTMIFENTLLSDQYLQYLNAMKSRKAIYMRYYINNLLYKNFLAELFYQKDFPTAALEEIAPIMRENLKIENYNKILEKLDTIPEIKEENNELVKYAFKTKSDYYLLHISRKIKEICVTWWWDDYTLQSSIYNLAKDHLTSSNELNNATEDSQSINLCLSMSKGIMSKCKFLYFKGIRTAQEGIHKQSMRYFEQVLNAAKVGYVYLTDTSDKRIVEIVEEFDKIIEKTRLVFLISQLTSHYNSISKNILINNKQNILSKLHEIKVLSEDYEPEIEIKYLSALPDLFIALASTLELLLSLGKEYDELSEELNHRLRLFANRLDVATNQIAKKLDAMNEINNLQTTRAELMAIKEDLTILLETISFVPISIIERISTIKRIETLQALTESIINDLIAFEHRDQNNILTLIHKGNANYYAHRSMSLLEDQPSGKLPRERIYAQYTGSLISGYQNEIELYELNLQYSCINIILPKFLIILTGNVIEKQIVEIKNSLDEDESFTDMLNQIEADCARLLQERVNKNIPLLSGIKWESISEKYILVQSINFFYQAIKLAILGSVSSQHSKFSMAHDNFLDAKAKAYLAVNPLEKSQNSQFIELSTHIFSFAQFCQDSASNTEMEGKVMLPVQEVVKLFRDMIFNL
ncbi:MAG: hypothetical protein INQ03_01880 [Candidatus Heimdallarchaeota archaeon]|nr:hypothetical protein [Candidatus Heimdallarchaeota archaeon]